LLKSPRFANPSIIIKKNSTICLQLSATGRLENIDGKPRG
jgi:hypothetical protein